MSIRRVLINSYNFHLVTLVLTASLLTACGGGGGGGSGPKQPESPPDSAANTPAKAEHPANVGAGTAQPELPAAPIVGGKPETEARIGEVYVFEPEIIVADDTTIVWSIDNKPAWADFNPANGRLTGMPGEEDIGTTPEITISVRSNYGVAELQPFSIEVTPIGNASVTLSWAPPTQNEDGSQLIDLSGYRIYYGTSPDELNTVVEINNPGLSTLVIADLIPNTYYFAATAMNASAVESDRSNLIAIDVGAEESKNVLADNACDACPPPG